MNFVLKRPNRNRHCILFHLYYTRLSSSTHHSHISGTNYIMRHFIIAPLLATILMMSMDIASSYTLPSPERSTQSVSRRDALERVGAIPFVGAALLAFAPPPSQAAEDKPKQTTETKEEEKARIMKEKIAASKTSYRKPDGESKSPFRLLNK